MVGFKSEKLDVDTIPNIEYFEELGKKLAEESIKNFRKELDEIFKDDE